MATCRFHLQPGRSQEIELYRWMSTLTRWKKLLLLLLLFLGPRYSIPREWKNTLCSTKKYKNQAGMNFTPPPPSQNSHAVRWHCTAESKRRVAEIKSWFLCRRPTHWLDPMTQRQLAEKCDEPGYLNISQSYEWLPLLLLNQLHGQLLQRMFRPTDRRLLRPKSVAF